MFERRAKKGQCFHRPYLGCREFACDFKLINNNEPSIPIDETRELGWMLYDMNFEKPDEPMPMFFKVKMEKGVIHVPPRNSEEVRS
jgi:CRISPR-associated protein Cas5d